MYINVWQRQLKPGMVGEAISFFKDGADPAPTDSEASGMIRQIVGVDHTKNEIIMITVWKSEKAFMDLVSSKQFEEFIAPLERFYASPLEVHDYEVVCNI